jgi:chemotaxis protein methyltransferase CheR
MAKLLSEELSLVDFENFRNFVKKICGVAIPADKSYLVQQRLLPLVKLAGCRNFTDFYLMVTGGGGQCFRESIISAITTHETSFFRDEHPFLTFKNHVLPHLLGLIRTRTVPNDHRRGARCRIWCSGSAAGQEPYSIAMLIREYLDQHPFGDVTEFDFQILATDICSETLARAIAGSYAEAEVKRGLPDNFRQRYFSKLGENWIVNDSVRKMIDFRRLNLVDSFALLGTFDVIFCRNVLIYFDNLIKEKILGQYHRMLANTGILVLGASEVLINSESQALFESYKFGPTILYRKNQATGSPVQKPIPVFRPLS